MVPLSRMLSVDSATLSPYFLVCPSWGRRRGVRVAQGLAQSLTQMERAEAFVEAGLRHSKTRKFHAPPQPLEAYE